MARILDDQPGGEPIASTYFDQWFAGRLPDDASELDRLTAYQQATDEDKARKLQQVVDDWERALAVPLATFTHESFKGDMVRAVRAMGWDNVIDLTVLDLLNAGCDVFEGGTFIEVYRSGDERDEDERQRLRAVYEAARRVLRFNGVDRERTEAAVTELEDAIASVMSLDSGHEDAPAPTVS
jgi:hypothetical protein